MPRQIILTIPDDDTIASIEQFLSVNVKTDRDTLTGETILVPHPGFESLESYFQNLFAQAIDQITRKHPKGKFRAHLQKMDDMQKEMVKQMAVTVSKPTPPTSLPALSAPVPEKE